MMDVNKGSHGTMVLENTEKRDTLRATEAKYRQLWQEERLFESNAPSCSQYPPDTTDPAELRAEVPKFFGAMAYPYVNGIPHLGHAFTLSKADFTARVARAQGKQALYPQGYHGTGMPIKACADKLVREIAMFGKDFEGYNEEAPEGVVDAHSAAPTSSAVPKEDVTKFTNAKKGKAVLKTAKARYQFQVMLALGIERSEIHKFADARHWLEFFPQLWQAHMTDFGLGIDWRRSFITTDANPYYDSFVRWQIQRLREFGKLRFGKRYTIYSPKDSQPCLDHDRATGEAVQVQEYLALKCKVVQWSDKAREIMDKGGDSIPSDAAVFLVPATLRPETMSGQTNVFVSPSITYGIFKVTDSEYFLATDRAARNMSFQGVSPEWGSFPRVLEISGSDIVGSVVHAPLSQKGNVYVLPMATIKETKGTGVVTSVPSDSPDDYVMTRELFRKAQFYGINPEWVCLEIFPIIETPEYGNSIAPALIERLKINSPRDEQKLVEAKEVAYKLGFYNGKMVAGEFAGKTVQEAKPLIKQRLLDSGEAFSYNEPDGLVISRSGDECVAAYLDQWYLTYGDADPAWREDTLRHLRGEDGQGFETFGSATKHALEQTLGWMGEWSVSRQFGLGTQLPWDPSQLVEGLSDSTIYMAYYTVAHYLHSDIFGRTNGLGGIDASQMTAQVWDYVFALRDDVESDIAKDTLDAMRREFTYWYPPDIRVSAKDLINNHLVFFLYIHQAIWGEKQPQFLPKAIRLNGHLMINGEKMSKSTGNFLTLTTAIQKFGADATRMALADGGDAIEDANFEETMANSMVLKLFELRKWIEEVIGQPRILKNGESYFPVRQSEGIKSADTIQRAGVRGFWDKLFNNEINALARETIDSYERTNFKAALKSGFFDFTAARDTYRAATNSASVGMHREALQRFVELQVLLISIIAPHWADYIWREVLGKTSSVQVAPFPKVPDVDPSLQSILSYVKHNSARINAADAAQQKKLAKGKVDATRYNPNADKRLTIYVAKRWPAWQEAYLDMAREMIASGAHTIDVKSAAGKMSKSDMKKGMPFVQSLKRRLDAGESPTEVLRRDLGFDEVQVLKELVPVLKATVPRLREVQIVVVGQEGESVQPQDAGERTGSLPTSSSAEPGSPSLEFTNM